MFINLITPVPIQFEMQLIDVPKRKIQTTMNFRNHNMKPLNAEFHECFKKAISDVTGKNVMAYNEFGAALAYEELQKAKSTKVLKAVGIKLKITYD